jgi:hypothetical protein
MFDGFFRLTRNVPKAFDPKTHEVLDWLTTSAFLLMGAAFWGRHKRATATALINAGLVASLIFATDYEGTGEKPLSFRQHADGDLIQAALAAGLPTILGFGETRAAIPFRIQAGNEMLVVSATDFEGQGTIAGRRMRPAA